MAPPPISVVLPVFNAERFVGQSLDSISTQTFLDFEAIVIDDGSTDRSLEFIRSRVGSDARFRIVSRPNMGLVATLNEGIELARGKYVFRMDADDVSHPERFASELRYLETHDDCVALGTRILLADEEMLPIIEMVGSFTHEDIDAENLRGAGLAMCHPAMAMRRAALVSIGGYRRAFEWAEDLDLFLRLAEVGRLANLPEVLLTYRQHVASVGYKRRLIQVERASAAVSDARRRRGLGDVGSGFSDAGRGAVPAVDPSLAAIHRKWAWLALIGGHPRTARKHALKALVLQPFNRDNVRLLACAARGH